MHRPPAHLQALAQAHATLTAGCAFVMLRAEKQSISDAGLAMLSHTRMIGNQLRELDRFLANLIDETASCLGASGEELRLFLGLRNTSKKLHLLGAMTKLCSGHETRLRAIGRISACLHHCSGEIHAVESLRIDVWLAHGEVQNATCPADFTDRLRLAPQILISICRFYTVIGRHLLIAALGGKDTDFRVVSATGR